MEKQFNKQQQKQQKINYDKRSIRQLLSNKVTRMLADHISFGDEIHFE